jgi:hypothetical protein
MIDEKAMRQRWETVGSKLDERGRRLFAAGEVWSAGWGGLAAVSVAQVGGEVVGARLLRRAGVPLAAGGASVNVRERLLLGLDGELAGR